MAFDIRRVDLGKLNSLTKYPSILTYHALGEKGILQETVQIPFTDSDRHHINRFSQRFRFSGFDQSFQERRDCFHLGMGPAHRPIQGPRQEDEQARARVRADLVQSDREPIALFFKQRMQVLPDNVRNQLILGT